MIDFFIIFMYFIFALFVTSPIWGVFIVLLIFKPKNKKGVVKNKKFFLYDDRYDKFDKKKEGKLIRYEDVIEKREIINDNNLVFSDNIGYVLDIYGICAGIMFFAYRMSIERTGNSYTNGSFTDLLLFLGVVPIFIIYAAIRVSQYSEIKELSQRLYLILLIFVFCIFVPGYPKLLWVLPLILAADFITKNRNGIVFIFSVVLFVVYLFFGKINPTWHLFDKEEFVISKAKYEEMVEKEKERKAHFSEEEDRRYEREQDEKKKREVDVEKKKVETDKLVREKLRYLLDNPDKFGYKFDVDDTNFEFGVASFTISYDGLKTDTLFINDVLEKKQFIKSYSYVNGIESFSFLDKYENSNDDKFVREIFNKFIGALLEHKFNHIDEIEDLGVRFMDVKFKHVKDDVSELIIEYNNDNSSDPWNKNELLRKMIKRNYFKYFQEVPSNMKLKVTLVDENKKKDSFLTTMESKGVYIDKLD